jgi:signal peptidase II
MLTLCLSFFIALLDQVTKHIIKTSFNPGEHISVVAGFFDVVYIQNPGAAWGMLSGFNGWLILISVAMVIALIVFRRHFITDSPVHRIVMGLMIGGVIGNLVDRVKWGRVVDFLDFHWNVHHFPAFNVADSSICIGVGLYIISQLFNTGDKEQANAEDKPKQEVPKPDGHA